MKREFYFGLEKWYTISGTKRVTGVECGEEGTSKTLCSSRKNQVV